MVVPAREVEMEARRLLRKHGVASPPVPVEEIARKMGVLVRREPFEGDVSGVLHRSGDTKVIGINALDGVVRQRFTIAHEIGHLLLHDETLHIDRHYVGHMPTMSDVGPSRRFMRDKVSAQASDLREIQANRFAASLLMPRSFLDKEIKKLRIPARAEDVQSLARRYRVSQQAMIFRLMNLGVPLESV